jgi:hypothetical protein
MSAIVLPMSQAAVGDTMKVYTQEQVDIIAEEQRLT